MCSQIYLVISLLMSNEIMILWEKGQGCFEYTFTLSSLSFFIRVCRQKISLFYNNARPNPTVLLFFLLICGAF